MNYCLKYNVQLVPEKTKLMAFSPKGNNLNLEKDALSSVYLDGHELTFSTEAQHLGILRSSCSGNMPAIMDRLAAHRKQLFSLLPIGMARHHNGNPASSLSIESIYCLPTLISGLASLVLSKAEINIIDKYRKDVLLRLMKLPSGTPDAAVYFLAGSLPTSAFLHQRQLSLFNMICHLENNFLKSHAMDVLTKFKQSQSKSWFHSIQDLCMQYSLPHPLLLLDRPVPKEKFKDLVNCRIHDTWRIWLTDDASASASLSFFKVAFMSLKTPHPIWTSLDGNPYQAKAAFIQAAFLSGKYRTERVCRFWSKNVHGICLQRECFDLKLLEDRTHVLLHCKALNEKRRRLTEETSRILDQNPIFKPIVNAYLFSDTDDLKMNFLLDCSTLPMVIRAKQLFGNMVFEFMFKISRNWCRALHRERLKLLGRSRD